MIWNAREYEPRFWKRLDGTEKRRSTSSIEGLKRDGSHICKKLFNPCMDGSSNYTKLEPHGGTKMKEPRYQEIVDSYPCDRDVYGALRGEASKVVDDYNDLYRNPDADDLSESEAKIRGRIARKREFDEMSEISSNLADVVNGHSPEMVAKALYMGLCVKHRTLQASAIKAIIELLKLYKDTDYDLRNRAAVAAAAVISQVVEDESLFIPLI